MIGKYRVFVAVVLAILGFAYSSPVTSGYSSFYADPKTTLRVVYEVAYKLHGDVRFAEFVRALCFTESGGAHFNKDGSVKIRANSVGNYDIGLFQINTVAHPGFGLSHDPEKNLFYGINFAWGKWLEWGKDPLRAAWAYKGKTLSKYEYAKRVVSYMKNPPKGMW